MKTNIEVTLEDIAKCIIGARRAGSKKKFMELMEDLENGFQNKSNKKKDTLNGLTKASKKDNIQVWKDIIKENSNNANNQR